jgi:retron-type reverse transcriptase
MAPGAGNPGARSAGIDGQTASSIDARRGEAAFLADLRADIRARTFRPVVVGERMIPKPGGKRRRLGIPAVRDRVVQAARQLVLEPIFRGGLRAVLVWLPARATSAGRDRRDPLPRQSLP